jgi:hypothetical protein
MRFLICAATVVFGLACIPASGAADLGIGGRSYFGGDYYVNAERAGALIVYDFEPGTMLRAYWLPPWRNRHYFPFHAAKIHHVSSRSRPKPAESYFRYWSNDGAFIAEPPPAALRSFDATPAPRRHQGSTRVKPNKDSYQ